jgi:N-acyl-phosphatidylethanolamine-hydrolysing phospholipase D
MAAARALVLGLALAACAPRLPAYPASPQWRDGRFHNPPAWPQRKGVREFLRWFLAGRPPFDGFEPPFVRNDGAALRRQRERTSLTWIGHATVLVQSRGCAFLTDPNFAERLGPNPLFRRHAPPGVALDQLPPIDFALISHNHRDHLDADSVKALGPGVTFLVPLGLAAWFRHSGLPRVIELDWWASAEVAGARVTLVPAQHWSQRGLHDRDQTLWGGFIVELGGYTFYHAGDTGYPAAFREIGRRFPHIDFAFLPIGAYTPRWYMSPFHMAPEQAAQAFRELGARELVPIHWATFYLSDEPMREPPRVLYEAMGRLANRILFLPIGGTYWAD